jgi:hypothetical protein
VFCRIECILSRTSISSSHEPTWSLTLFAQVCVWVWVWVGGWVGVGVGVGVGMGVGVSYYMHGEKSDPFVYLSFGSGVVV